MYLVNLANCAGLDQLDQTQVSRDFVVLGREMNLQVERGLALSGDGRSLRLDPAGVFANLLAEQAVFLLRRA